MGGAFEHEGGMANEVPYLPLLLLLLYQKTAEECQLSLRSKKTGRDPQEKCVLVLR